MTRLEFALHSLRSSRSYTNATLDKIDPADWFRMPEQGVTHVAWQVGHLAVAEFRLASIRIWGDRPTDAAILPPGYVPLFGKGSTPDPDPSKYPSAGEIRAVFDRVHEAVLAELPKLDDASLDILTEPAHAIATTRFEAILWAARHEMVHTGQIALLRRLFGAPVTW